MCYLTFMLPNSQVNCFSSGGGTFSFIVMIACNFIIAFLICLCSITLFLSTSIRTFFVIGPREGCNVCLLGILGRMIAGLVYDPLDFLEIAQSCKNSTVAVFLPSYCPIFKKIIYIYQNRLF